jgi:molybdopterin-dependent oxidoreductase alpha subunit
VFKTLVAEDWLDREFIAANTAGFDEARRAVEAQNWETIERESGTTRARMLEFAQMLRDAKNGIFVWGMGLTQHAHGVQTVETLLNVALARGWLGREKVGVMPIRGHSGVQGGAEVGCVPAVDAQQQKRFEQDWGFTFPDFPGLSAGEMIDAAARGEIGVFWITGGNFLETLPDPAFVQRALERTPVRIHQDVVVTSMMLADSPDTVILFPATTRYESPGGGTETSTERRIIFSPEIPGRRIGSAKPEWEVFGEVASQVRPDRRARFRSSQEIRDEIGRVIPLYAGIEKLGREGDQFQWGGARLFADGRYATADGKAHFAAHSGAGGRGLPPAMFRVSSRRGKQFNSMVQKQVDPLTGAARRDILMAPEDAERLGLRNGDPVRLRSSAGEYEGSVRIDRMKPGNLEVHWPEANALFTRDARDPASKEPDYNAVVEVIR